MSPARLFYTAAWLLLTPLILPRLVWRARQQREYLRHVPERFGFYRRRTCQSVIWVHAVSVGETRAAAPLLRELRRHYPGHAFLVTHMTPTGRATAESLFDQELFEGRVHSAYLPYDYPGAAQRFLAHFHPTAGVLLETEIWPNLIAACGRAGVPLFLVNARLSERSARGYARLPGLTRESLRGLAGVAAQTEADAERLSKAGADDVQVFGNLKFDAEPPPGARAVALDLRSQWGMGRRVLVAASTREGEEALLLDAWAGESGAGESGAGAPDDWLLVIVPRHPQRFEEVARLIEARGLAYARRSAAGAVAPAARVVLGDSMGELYAYYAAADVAFVGGSLLPFGGQNLIEACAVGRPVLVGPHTFNFAQATAAAVAAGACRRVADVSELIEAAADLLTDPDGAERMALAGTAFATAHRGAARKTADWLADRLDALRGAGRRA